MAWRDHWPWRGPDGSVAPAARRGRFPAPAVAVYLAGSTLLFWAFGPRRGPTVSDAPQWWWDLFAYRAEDLVQDLPATLLHFATSVWANVHWLQFAYVTVLLLGFGVWFERREGSLRATAVFYLGSIVAGIVAGAALLIIDATTSSAWWANEADRIWVGGSAGAYALIGATAARARRPGAMLAAALLWEVGLAIVYLHRATPLFHVTALATGFAWTRWGPLRPSGSPAGEGEPVVPTRPGPASSDVPPRRHRRP